MRRPSVEGRNGVRRGGKKPGTRTCNCKMDQEARAGIVGASVLPPLQRDRRIYDNRDPAHCFSSHVFVAANRLSSHLSSSLNLITPLHSPDAQSVNSGDRLIAAIEQIFVCVVASV